MRLRPAIVILTGLLAVTACGAGQTPASDANPTPAATGETAFGSGAVIDQTVLSLHGEPVDLRQFRGRPVLIVNTASKCGYTPQYAGLQKLYETYGDRGLVVIGFPSNDFGNQEPGDSGEIENFCRLNYGVTFPMMAKIHTKGPDQAAIYRALTTETAEEFRGEVQWNFTKFLVDGDGHVVARFESAVDPLDPQVTAAIETLLSPPTQG
jgi:glutathione peroxidase